MKNFIAEDFLLETPTAVHLYETYAKPQPLIDYHCHISPRDIYENKRFRNLTEVWLGGRQADGSYFGDHYKWRIMRANAVPEPYVSGEADDYVRFLKFTEALELAAGNPLFHWCHLELRRFFGYEGVLNQNTAKEVWEHTSHMLQNDPEFCVCGLIKKMNVAFIGTTDDPTDDLIWHRRLSAEKDLSFIVCPSFRPDKAISIRKDTFPDYIKRLAESIGKTSLDTVSEVLSALSERLEYFCSMGCRASDHGLDYAVYRPMTPEKVEEIYQKRLSGAVLSTEEAEGYQTAVLMHLAREYARLDIVMQIHYNALRNANTRAFSSMGADTGFDCINTNHCIAALVCFMDALEQEGKLPRMVLYSLNEHDDTALQTVAGCFQDSSIPGKIQHGSAWWFNDQRDGIERQLRSLANTGLIGNFIGMLTDSRSFLSYPRFEYFRRIFCNLIGSLVENGAYPNDEQMLKRLIEGVCVQNAKRYFRI